MKKQCIIIKNNKMISIVDFSYFSKRAINEWVKGEGGDGWFELDKEGVEKILGIY